MPVSMSRREVLVAAALASRLFNRKGPMDHAAGTNKNVTGTLKRVAVLCDIHGNLSALKAVLIEAARADVDAIICGGDVIVGPMSREVLDLLGSLSTPVHYVLGNCETAVIEQLGGKSPTGVPELYRPAITWTTERVRGEYAKILASWPKTLSLEVIGVGKVFFCHGTPRNENEIFTRVSPEGDLLPLFEPLSVSMVVCGHTHMQFDRMIGRTRVVNAGSVGMPWGRPGAEWLLLGPGVEVRHTDYDVSSAVNAVTATGYPDPGAFFVRGVTEPPSIAQMEQLYERTRTR